MTAGKLVMEIESLSARLAVASRGNVTPKLARRLKDLANLLEREGVEMAQLLGGAR